MISVGDISLDSKAAKVPAEVALLRQLAGHQQSLVAALARAAEFRDPYTAGHQAATADLASLIAAELGVQASDVAAIALGASIHDIGKIAIPAEILSHPGPLSSAETEIMRTHCRVGAEILGDTELPHQVVDIVLHHHERLDGSGYPAHLVGDEISLPARIVAVADVLDAMSSHRPYHPALGLGAALAEIRDGSGSRYDAAVCAASLRVARAHGHPPVAVADGSQRDEYAALRDDRALLREEQAGLRAHAAQLRSANAAARDEAADARVLLLSRESARSAARSRASDTRDEAAERRDRLAEERDVAARHFEASGGIGAHAQALVRAEKSRQEAAADRRQAAEDRRLDAADRHHEDGARQMQSEHYEASASERAANAYDRVMVSDDLRALADHRALTRRDRIWGTADRTAAAGDRGAASLDQLTGVYLRGPGLIELDREISRSRRTNAPLTVAFVDIDDLKSVNDANGHAAGDRLIRAVANTLKLKLRPYDVIARLGGDEFVCGLSGLDMAGARRRLTDVNAALAAAPEHGAVTVGIAQLATDDTLESVIGRADADLYRQRACTRQSRSIGLNPRRPDHG